MKINHLIKLALVLFAFSGFVACSSSAIRQIQADYEAGNLTVEQRDAAIAAQREVERAKRARRRTTSIVSGGIPPGNSIPANTSLDVNTPPPF